jgi:hypothetical protein
VAAEYHFVTNWKIPGTAGEVAEVLGDLLGLARWALRARLRPFRYIDGLVLRMLAHVRGRRWEGIRDGRSESGLQHDAG